MLTTSVISINDETVRLCVWLPFCHFKPKWSFCNGLVYCLGNMTCMFMSEEQLLLNSTVSTLPHWIVYVHTWLSTFPFVWLRQTYFISVWVHCQSLSCSQIQLLFFLIRLAYLCSCTENDAQWCHSLCQMEQTILANNISLRKVIFPLVYWTIAYSVDNSFLVKVHSYLLGKRGYVFGSIGLSVCLFVCSCGQHYSKSYERIGMKLYGGVLGSRMKNWLNFGGDLGILRWVNE